jgi:hypothetical protein
LYMYKDVYIDVWKFPGCYDLIPFKNCMIVLEYLED